MSSTFVITPEVNATQEFIEIAQDFANPLEIVREAISNAFDARAKVVKVLFDVVDESGESTLRIRIHDDGCGMDNETIRSFFDLGNSLSRSDKEKIGEKGHGTKVYLNSRSIEVTTSRNGKKLHAIMEDPFRKLHKRTIPEVKCTEMGDTEDSGTCIEILGYNNNRRERFTHHNLRDYVNWFTKFGSIERELGISDFADVTLELKGLDRETPEQLAFGHTFPDESESTDKLFEKHMVAAPDFYCKRFVRTGTLKNYPEVSYHAVFYVEGNKVKWSYNPMLQRPGYSAPKWGYKVQDRYGIWLCKDFIPIQRKNEWVTVKGTEFTRFHAFFNCQSLRLTANRGSADNTPSEIMQDIREEVEQFYDEIVSGKEWQEIDWLESEADAYRTAEKERKDYSFRIDRIRKGNVAEYKGIMLVEPHRESGVYSLFVQLGTLEPGLFPFQILDYDTHEGIDLIVKGDRTTPITSSKLYYVEFKYFLSPKFNHSFENLHSIVCWDTQIKHDEVVTDIQGKQRKFQIVQPQGEDGIALFFLDDPKAAHKIQVYVLRDFVKSKLSIEFKPRTNDATL